MFSRDECVEGAGAVTHIHRHVEPRLRAGRRLGCGLASAGMCSQAP